MHELTNLKETSNCIRNIDGFEGNCRLGNTDINKPATDIMEICQSHRCVLVQCTTDILIVGNSITFEISIFVLSYLFYSRRLQSIIDRLFEGCEAWQSHFDFNYISKLWHTCYGSHFYVRDIFRHLRVVFSMNKNVL